MDSFSAAEGTLGLLFLQAVLILAFEGFQDCI